MKKKEYYVDIIKRYHHLKEDPAFPFNNVELFSHSGHSKIIKEKKRELDELMPLLNKIPKDYVNQFKDNLRQAINKVLELTEKKSQDYLISRSQGMIISNYVFAKAIDILAFSIKNVEGLSWSPFYRTIDIKDGIDLKGFRKILEHHETLFSNKNYDTYTSFERDADELIHKIVEIWKRENETHPTGTI